MEKSKYIIDTRYNHMNKLIFINEPSKDEFLEQCKKVFKINCDQGQILLTTSTGAPIPEKRIENLIEAAGPYLSVHLYLDRKDGKSGIVIPNDIKSYLIEKNATSILDENECGNLTEKSRRLLIRHLLDFQIERFGPNATNAQKDSIATATSFVFKSLSANVVKGFCSIRSANERSALRKQQKNNPQNSVEKEIDRTDAECAADIEILKTLAVCPQNMSTIKEKLIATQKYRFKMMENMDIDLLEFFPYFFTDPSLILFDFSEWFKNVDSNAFLDEWPNLRKRLNTILINQYKSSIQTLWPKEIQDILILLKLVHAKASKNLISVKAFTKAIDKLIIFRKSDVPLDKLCEKTNKYPYIIAVGDSIDDITHYYIDLEKHLMMVPQNFGIAETFDLFLKTHESTGLHFDLNIKPMANFCLHFIFGIKKIVRPSPLLKNLRDSMKLIEQSSK